jgi:ATP-binding protein involved in chromosome partitioning
VNYGKRDYLIVTCRRNQRRYHQHIASYIPELDGALIVTSPSQVSQAVAHKAAIVCRKAGIDNYGVVENLSGFTCPKCHKQVNIMQKGGGERLAEALGVPFLGHIPMDKRVAECADQGTPFVYKYPDWEPSKMLLKVAKNIDEKLSKKGKA